MDSYITTIANRQAIFTENELKVGNLILSYDKMSNIKYKNGEKAGFIFNYDGRSVLIPCDSIEKSNMMPFFQKAVLLERKRKEEEERKRQEEELLKKQKEDDALTTLDFLTNEPNNADNSLSMTNLFESKVEPEKLRLLDALTDEVLNSDTQNNVESFTNYSSNNYQNMNQQPQSLQQNNISINPNMTNCKHCGALIAKNAKRCPQCGGKNKYVKGWLAILFLIIFPPIGIVLTWLTEWKKVAKIILTILFALWLMLAIALSGESSTDSNIENSSSSSTTTQTEQTESTESVESTKEAEKIEYKEVTADELLKTLDENPLNAEDYEGQYLSVKGKLANIDSDGKYIGLDSMNSDIMTLNYVHCNIMTDEQKNQIKKLKIGDEITVKGKMIDVGEVMGYELDIDSIE